MASWFQYAPVSKQAPKKVVRVLFALEKVAKTLVAGCAIAMPRHARHSRQLRRI